MPSLHTPLETALAHAKSLGADAAEAQMAESASLDVQWRKGMSEGMERSESLGLGVRVFVGKKQATVSSSDLSDAAVKTLVERAVAMAKVAPDDPYARLAHKGEFTTDTSHALDLYDANEPSPEHLMEQAHIAEQTAVSHAGITNSEGANAAYTSRYRALMTSEGFFGEMRSSLSSLSVSVLGGEGTDMQRDYDYSMARHAEDLKTPEAIGNEAATRTLARLSPRKVKTQHVPVVFDPRVGRSLIGSLIGALSGAAIARGTSFVKDKLGEPLFPKHVTIMDEPGLIRGLGSRPFDGEGIGCAPLALVQEGVLQHWLLDIATAAQLNLQTNGRASRGLASQPSPSATNVTLLAGALPVEALMKDIKNGFYVTETFGMGINTTTGDYSQGAGGFWIENGKISYPVAEITIAGKMLEMFADLTPANDLKMEHTVNVPTFRVEKMMVAGS